jgi:hypothetical protein
LRNRIRWNVVPAPESDVPKWTASCEDVQGLGAAPDAASADDRGAAKPAPQIRVARKRGTRRRPRTCIEFSLSSS